MNVIRTSPMMLENECMGCLSHEFWVRLDFSTKGVGGRYRATHVIL